MSDLNQVHSALTRLFFEEDHRIVFWNDPDREFEEILPTIMLEGVEVVRLDRVAALAAKIRVERDKPEQKFLLYSPKEEPDFEQDWLLDIRLYSRSFRADRASILLQQLGLTSPTLRPHIALRRKFFDSKERVQKLKVSADDTEADLDRKMIAVIAKAEQPEFFVILRTILHFWTDRGGAINLAVPPAAWEQIEKFELDAAFWAMAKESFGYEDREPTLKALLYRLLVTDFAYHVKGEIPAPLRPFLLPKVGWSNAVVCLAQWRDSSSKGESYDRLSAEVSAALKVRDHLAPADPADLHDVMTFLDIEKHIAGGLRDLVRTTKDTMNADEVRAVANRRRSGHWANDTASSTEFAPREELNAVYRALVAGADLFTLRSQHAGGFDANDGLTLYRAYENESFRFDQLYRHFCEAADIAAQNGWEILKSLRQDIEAAYLRHLEALAISWGKLLESGLLASWNLPEVRNQTDFYRSRVQSWIDKDESRRAFVVISDGFRFEAAQELETELNGKYRFQAELTSQLGVLPSYTSLGMASLLPHTKLSYNDKGEVLADGKPTATTADRNAILKKSGGLAIRSEDLLEKKKDEGRELIKDRRVVYIYHNTIDAIGDAKQSEHKTFEAVRQAINELATIVGYIVNNLNGHYIIVTADHGFLFTESPPTETEKSKITDQPKNIVKTKKRYLLGRNLPKSDVAWHGTTKVTAGAEGDMEFWIPKGVNRFHFVAGARYVHGGAMPQEIAVPVLTVKQVRGKSKEETKTKPVSVQVLGTNHRITTGRHRFQFIQMDSVSERVKPVTLRLAVYEGGTPVTNVETVTFESTSDSIEDRKKWVSLVLLDRPYSKKTSYKLILRDTDDIEQLSVDVVIDRAFSDDF